MAGFSIFQPFFYNLNCLKILIIIHKKIWF